MALLPCVLVPAAADLAFPMGHSGHRLCTAAGTDPLQCNAGPCGHSKPQAGVLKVCRSKRLCSQALTIESHSHHGMSWLRGMKDEAAFLVLRSWGR